MLDVSICLSQRRLWNGEKMNKIVLCIDNGDSGFEEIKQYLVSRECRVYTLSERQDIRTLIERIDQDEGRLDLLILGAGGQIPEDGAIGEKHDCGMLLELLCGQINRAGGCRCSASAVAQRRI